MVEAEVEVEDAGAEVEDEATDADKADVASGGATSFSAPEGNATGDGMEGVVPASARDESRDSLLPLMPRVSPSELPLLPLLLERPSGKDAALAGPARRSLILPAGGCRKEQERIPAVGRETKVHTAG